MRSPDGVPAARDEDSQPRGYVIGECGHRRPIWPTGHVDACECDTASPHLRRRYLLGDVIELADDAPGLTDAELRDRLAVLANRARDSGTSPADPRPAVG